MNKEKITISVSPSIIRQIDSFIADQEIIKNRSQAIEYALDKFFLPQGIKVVILAGGKGVKMRPFTYELPKAMLPVQNKPLLAHTIRDLVKNNFKNITIIIGDHGEKIEKHFGNGEKFGATIRYVKDNKQTGTAQALAAAGFIVDNGPVLVIYGDVLARIDWLALITAHEQNKSTATLAVTSRSDANDWGVIEMDGNRITNVLEKPKKGATRSLMINAGIFVANREIFDLIRMNTKSLEKETFLQLAKTNELSGYVFSGQWFDVGTMAGYEDAIKNWK